MTKQILLKTPRGNTAVIPVDHFVSSNKKQSSGCYNGDSYVVETSVLTSTAGGATGTGSFTIIDATNINFDDAYHNQTDINRQRKEELLYELIEASKRRDVGRKRNVRCLYNSDEGEEDDLDDYNHNSFVNNCDTMDIDDVCHAANCCYGSEDDNEPCCDGQNVKEEESVTLMIDGIDINSDSSINPFVDRFGNSTVNKSRRRRIDSGTRSMTASSTNIRQQKWSTLPRREDRRTRTSNHEDKVTPFTSNSSHLPSLMVAFYHQGRKVSLDRIWSWIKGSSEVSSTSDDATGLSLSEETFSTMTSSTSSIPQFPLYLTLSTSVRLLGGIDRQNRVGSKFGGGGVSSSQNAERERKERLKQLALESIDLAKDPYLMRNHLGTYECKLCLTLHTNEANYLAHTQGKKHQQGLAKRAHMEKIRKEREEQNNLKRPPPGSSQYGPSIDQQQSAKKSIKIGRPAYQVFKSRDVETNQRCLTFELTYKDINENLRPRHRFMSAYEQKVDVPPDRRYQYVLFAAEPYETVAFKIPNEPIDRNLGRLITYWDDDDKKFTLTLYYADATNNGNKNDDDEDVDMTTTDGLPTTCTPASSFAPALGST